MIELKTKEFDLRTTADKIAFLSKEPLVQEYMVCLIVGVGMACTGEPTYNDLMQTLLDAGTHVKFKTPTGLDTVVNRNCLFIARVNIAQTTVVYAPGNQCVVAECLEDVEAALNE